MRGIARLAPLTLAAAAILVSGCQDYPFSSVKRCVIQPGTSEVTLSNVSTADVLFVVDDSGSMQAKQQKLADSFSTFIGLLNGFEQNRVSHGLEPFDFHIAITTTSIFFNPPSGATCQASCGGASNVCCFTSSNTPQVEPLACPTGSECGAGFSCRTDCPNHDGEQICCNGSGAPQSVAVACDPVDAPGAACGALHNRYVFPREPQTCTSGATCTTSPYTSCITPTAGQIGCGGFLAPSGEGLCCTPPPTTAAACNPGFALGNCAGLTGVCCWQGSPTYPQGDPNFVVTCTPGVAQEGTLYPHGSFVGYGTNPRVLHYDKQLYGTPLTLDPDGPWTSVDTSTSRNKQGFTIAQLNGFFSTDVNVGTCGSGQEQGLQASRLAILKALAGQQLDVVNASGQVASPPVVADWPHAGAKLVVVYVGDEDDCGSPEDPFRGVVLQGSAGNDTCVHDAMGKEFPVGDIVFYLQSLKRPLGAAFIESTAQTTCNGSSCTAGTCCDYQCTGSSLTCGTDTCGGQAPASRFLAAAGQLTTGGADVVAGSICDPGAIACSSSADCPSGSTCSSSCLGAPPGSYCCLTSPASLDATLAGTTGFAPILSQIAEIVKPPSALVLPTAPATGKVTMLRVLQSDGTVRKVCNGPALPPLTYAQAVAQGYDWWFTDPQVLGNDPSAPSKSVYINHLTNDCEANPGETYSAEYLGLVPTSGCTGATQAIADGACATALGALDPGDPGAGKGWTCFAGLDGTGACPLPSGTAVGTCVCGSRAQVCPGG